MKTWAREAYEKGIKKQAEIEARKIGALPKQPNPHGARLVSDLRSYAAHADSDGWTGLAFTLRAAADEIEYLRSRT